MRNNIINIENRAGKIKLNDSVNKDSADQLIDELEQLYGASAVATNMQIGDVTCSAENALESVNVEINSPGGSVMEGQRIYNALKGISSRGVEVITTVSGLAASMGSVILMAGDQRKMTHGSRIMIHEASVMAYGDADDLRKQSNILESISSEIAEIYAEKANGSAEDMRELMKDETWMTASEAEKAGFVDVIIKDGKESADNNSNQPQPTNNKPMFSKDKDLTAKLEASQAEVTDLESTITKREAESVTLSEDLTTANALVSEYEATIKDLAAQLEASAQATAETVEAAETIKAEVAEKADLLEAKDAEIEQAKEITDEAVSAKAAELVQVTTHQPVADLGDEANNKLSSDEFWAEYKQVGEERGLEAKNVWYAENKHRKL
tara:strand:- start:4240 stop:5385 length:1146 start_codon:yes stop_codon:yes gene_type:complete